MRVAIELSPTTPRAKRLVVLFWGPTKLVVDNIWKVEVDVEFDVVVVVVVVVAVDFDVDVNVNVDSN